MKQFGGSANLYYNNYLLNKSFNEYFNEIDEFDIDTWRYLLVDDLKKRFLEKDCFMCNNNVPEEGVVLRKENLLKCDSLKLKSFRFLEKETKQLDTGESNIEESN